MIFTPNVPMLSETAEIIKNTGLECIYFEDAPPIIIETGEKFRFGSPVKDYSAFGLWDGKYVTKRKDCSVVFDINDNTISYK